MSRKTLFMLPAAGLLAGIGLVMACSGESPAAPTLEEAGARFAWDLYGRLAAEEGNLFFSPYSASSALGMTLLGARGQTQKQMQEVIFGGGDHHEELGGLTRWLAGGTGTDDAPGGVPQPGGLRSSGGPGQLGAGPDSGGLARTGPHGAEERPYELTVANALWLQEGFPLREEFMSASRRHYGASPFEVDYRTDPESARGRINDWVAEETRQRIQDLLAPGSLTPLTRLVLTNAVYFKSSWDKQFQEPATQPEPFRLADGTTVETPMMRQTDRFAYREIEGAQVLRLPYAGHDLAMIVVLPGAVDGLATLEKTLTGDALLELVAGRGEEMRRVAVMLPRFRIEQAMDLIPPL